MKFVRHIDRCCAAPTPCKRNVNMLHTPCRHGRRVISPCQSLGIDMTPKKMPLTSTSLLNNKICMDKDDTKNSLLGAIKHLKTQGIKHMIWISTRLPNTILPIPFCRIPYCRLLLKMTKFHNIIFYLKEILMMCTYFIESSNFLRNFN